MLEGLDAINWSKLHHAYGSAADVPGQIRSLTSSDTAVFDHALWSMFGNIYHQGSRWEASPYAIPFLCELVNSNSIQKRDEILNLVLYIGLGDIWRDDESLPFNVKHFFSLADGIVAVQYRGFTERFLAGGYRDPSNQQLMDQLDMAYQRDSYLALEAQADDLLKWASDADSSVAVLAITSFPWFPILHEQAHPILLKAIVSERPIDYKISALLTIGLIAAYANPDVKTALQNQLDLQRQLATMDAFAIRLASAIALVFLFGKDAPDSAAETLIEAEEHRDEMGPTEYITPYQRSLMGFRAVALHRLGL